MFHLHQQHWFALQTCPLLSSQPITVPNRRPSKQSSLLRNDSESSSFTNSPPTFGTSFGESEHFGGERLYGGQLTPVRNNPLREGGNPLMHQDVSCHSLRGVEQQVPPLPPRNGERGMVERGPHPSAGSFTKVSSSSLQRSNSSLNRMSPLTPTHSSYNGKWSRSEGMMVFEAQRQLSQQPAKMADPPNQLYGSDTRLDNRSNSSLDSDQGKVKLPAGWERGYCEKKEQVFFFNSTTGESAWCIQDVFKQSVSSYTQHTTTHTYMYTY